MPKRESKPQSSITDELKQRQAKGTIKYGPKNPRAKLAERLGVSEKRQSLWRGPEEDGITFSLLSRFLSCRERFRLLACEGLRPVDTFNHRIEYGQMWHTCEEAYARWLGDKSALTWQYMLGDYVQTLRKRYPVQTEQIVHWWSVCEEQFAIYLDYWRQHRDTTDTAPVLQEYPFDVPYHLPSGRVVRLRGKWDKVEIIGKGRKAGIYLWDHKTKGDIQEQQLRRQLTFDLQTMIYVVALRQAHQIFPTPVTNGATKDWTDLPVLGVRYNVVRRPLSGGKGSIVRHKPTKSNPSGETAGHFYARLGEIIREDPSHFFMRWQVEVSPQDVERFKRECLNPVLCQLCVWWDWVNSKEVVEKGPFHDGGGWGVHSRHPFGVYNPLDEGGSSELDEFLVTGSTVGLERVENLFPELG
jgi:hypothetical protein